MSRLGEILLKNQVIRSDQLARAMDEQKRTGHGLSQVLVQLNFTTESQILKSLEKHYQVPSLDLTSFQIQPAVISLVPKEFCDKHTLIPVQKISDTVLVVAFSDPTQISVRDDLRFLTRLKIQPIVGTEWGILQAIEKHYGANVSQIVKQVEQSAADEELDLAEDGAQGEVEGPIIKFVNAILNEAILKKASDIHFEPYEKKFRVRLRIDGNMVEASSQPITAASAISSRIKIMSKLDIAEKRRPQDGRLKLKYKNGKDMDFRVSVMPTIYGEKVVMRLLDKSNLQLDMTKLGFETEDLSIFSESIKLPQGMILITGPTGSGKTTTIYSALSELNQPDVNVSTAEDPVEFNLDGINQLQVNTDIGLTFAAALRTFLRQDPDIIMVGEIRDLETAEIAIKAASTGHLVVSTLHTNDAPQTVARLLEMGVAGYSVTSTIQLIVAQRLVGKNCENCKILIEVTPKVLTELGVDAKEHAEFQVFEGRGCTICNNTGIKGRIAIFEMMRMSERMKEAVLGGASSTELRKIARIEGMRTLRRSALLKLKRGETSIQEVMNSSVSDV